jgi:hypothetical protein
MLCMGLVYVRRASGSGIEPLEVRTRVKHLYGKVARHR